MTAGTRRTLRGFICVCALLLVAPAAAQAYVVTVHVHGAGAVTETTSAHLMNCQTPSTANSNLSVSDCVAGSSGGDYAWGWIVTLHASVPSAYASRGWQFQKWVDSSGGGQVNCDPQDQTGDYTNVDCTFQTFSDLAINLYFTDNTGPDTTITAYPSGTTASTNATFAFAASSDPDATFQCRLDRPGTPGSFAICGSPSDHGESYSNLTTNGSYTFSVRGVDPSGNIGATSSRTWTVDTIGPTVSLDPGGPAAGFVTNSTSAAFTFSANDSSATFDCKLDSPSGPGTFTVCGGPADHVEGYSGLADGAYTFTVRGRDSVNNIGNSVSRSWTVDTVKPVVTVTTGPANGSSTTDTAAGFEFTSNEPSSSFECKLDAGDYASCAGAKLYSGLAAGPHTFSTRAIDQAGNVGDAAQRSWTVTSATSDSGGGAGSSTPPVGQGGAGSQSPGGSDTTPPAVLRLVGGKLVAKWRLAGSSTRIAKLAVSGLPARASLTVSCKGKGCPFKTKRAGAKPDLTKLFAKGRLAAGTVITVTISAPGTRSKAIRFVTRKGKAPKASAAVPV